MENADGIKLGMQSEVDIMTLQLQVRWDWGLNAHSGQLIPGNHDRFQD